MFEVNNPPGLFLNDLTSSDVPDGVIAESISVCISQMVFSSFRQMLVRNFALLMGTSHSYIIEIE
jgi:hypothetical protein